MRTVLDTSVVLATDVAPIEGDIAISAATLAELHFGVLVTDDAVRRAERLRRLAMIERDFEPLPIDTDVARSYGLLAARVARIGRQPRARSMDILIAATAHAHQARLATRNGADLRGLEQLVEIVAV